MNSKDTEARRRESANPPGDAPYPNAIDIPAFPAGPPGEVAAWLRRQAWDADDRVDGLERAFRAGVVPTVDGDFRGWLLHSVSGTWLDRIFEWSSKVFSPWQGKRIDRQAGYADNLVTWFGMLMLRLLAPHAFFGRSGGRWHAVKMAARVESSRIVPGLSVLALDYEGHANRPLLGSVHDEIVEVVPGVCLGRAHVRQRNGSRRVVQWFLLQK